MTMYCVYRTFDGYNATVFAYGQVCRNCFALLCCITYTAVELPGSWVPCQPCYGPIGVIFRTALYKLNLDLLLCLHELRETLGIDDTHKHTHTRACINGHLSGTTHVSRYQKGKTNLNFTEATDSEWQWHQLGHMQVFTLLQTDNHTTRFFYRPDAFPASQQTASKL